MAGRGTYEAAFQSPTFGPAGMHDPVGNAYWGSIGKVLDDQIAKMKLANAIRGPQGALAAGASDALDAIGYNRMMPRGGSTPGGTDEADAAYAPRLDTAWDAWARAGTPCGVLTALYYAGFPVIPTPPNYWTTGSFIINHIGRIYQLTSPSVINFVGPAGACVNRQRLDGTVPSGGMTGFTLDARDQFFSRWCLLFPVDVPTLVNDAGNPVKACLNQICQQWTELGAHYAGCVVVPQETSSRCLGWPITNTLGMSGHVLGTNGARFINPE